MKKIINMSMLVCGLNLLWIGGGHGVEGLNLEDMRQECGECGGGK